MTSSVVRSKRWWLVEIGFKAGTAAIVVLFLWMLASGGPEVRHAYQNIMIGVWTTFGIRALLVDRGSKVLTALALLVLLCQVIVVALTIANGQATSLIAAPLGCVLFFLFRFVFRYLRTSPFWLRHEEERFGDKSTS